MRSKKLFISLKSRTFIKKISFCLKEAISARASQQAQNYNGEIGLNTNSNFKLLQLREKKCLLGSQYFAQRFNRPFHKIGQKNVD